MKKLGQYFKLGIVDDAGAYHVIAFSQKDTLETKLETIEKSSPKTGRAKTYTAGLTSWELAHDGFWGSAEKVFQYEGHLYTSDQLLCLLQHNGIPLHIRYIEEDGWLLVDGQALISQVTINSQVGSYVKMTVKLKGSGELEYTDISNQHGHFVCAYQGGTLTLFAAEAPISDVTIKYDGTELGEWTVGSATAEFPFTGALDVTKLTAETGDGEALDGITFEDVSLLHLVLQYRSEVKTSGETLWLVRPFWWNDWNLCDITILYAGGTAQTLPTQYLQNSGAEVQLLQDPAQIQSVALVGPQALDCCDITDATARTLTLKQTVMAGAYGGDVEISQPLACDLTISLRDSSGAVQATGTLTAGATAVTLTYLERIQSASQIRFQFQDREQMEATPYAFTLAMEEDLDSHTLLYAYNSTKHKMTVCCPDQKWPVKIYSGSTLLFEGMCRTPQTFTCSAGTNLSTERGDYTFSNQTNVDCWRIGSNFVFTKTLLFPAYLTLQGTRTGQTAPVLTTPEDEVAMTTVADGAEMDSDAVQKFTFRGIIGSSSYQISCFATDNGDDTVNVRVALTNILGETATLPVAVYVEFGDTLPLHIEIPAESSGATKVMTKDVLWMTPEAHASNFWAMSDQLRFTCYECVDVTSSHYYYYPVCTLSGKNYADIGYYQTSHGTIRFRPSTFPAVTDDREVAEIPAQFSIANHMTTYSGSMVTPIVSVVSGPLAQSVEPILAPDPTLLLMYHDGGEGNIKIINEHPHISSRLSAIGDVLKWMRVRLYRSTYAGSPVYNAVNLYNPSQGNGGLRPGDSATKANGSVGLYTGNTTVPSTESNGVLEFAKTSDGLAISATCLSQYVSVKSTTDTEFMRTD